MNGSLFIVAHPGHGVAGLFGGIVHPLMGIDHLLAILATGLLAARMGGRLRWIVPATFATGMGLGLVFGLGGAASPMLEPALAGTVVLLGLLVANRRGIGLRAAVPVAFAFAVLHGFAHGLEMPGSGNGVAFGIGMLLSSVGLLWVGLGLGTFALQRSRRGWLSFVGSGVALAGLLLAFP